MVVDMNYIFVAESGEAERIGDFQNTKIILTGVGVFSVIQTVSKMLQNGEIKPTDNVFNVGYCGSNISPIGSVHRVSISASETKSKYADFADIKLTDGNIICFTANDFVTQTDNIGLFDMELYALANIFPNIASYKIVSDSLNFSQYKSVSVDDAWKQLNDLLAKTIK